MLFSNIATPNMIQNVIEISNSDNKNDLNLIQILEMDYVSKFSQRISNGSGALSIFNLFP